MNPPTDDEIITLAAITGDPAPPTDGPAREPSELYRPAPPTGDPEYLCPNCVTPWKCNGPHIPEPTGDRPTDAEYIAQLESYNRTLHARLAAERVRADYARGQVEELAQALHDAEAETKDWMRMENERAQEREAERVRGDRLAENVLEIQNYCLANADVPWTPKEVLADVLAITRAALRATQGGTD